MIDENLTEDKKFYNKSKIFSEDIITNILMFEPTQNLSNNYIADVFNDYKGNDLLNNMMYTDLRLYMNDQLLHLTDRITMANSIEARVPFLDKRLVEFSLGLSSNHKISDTDYKMILKRAYHNLLPNEIINRKKWGFAAPDNNWVLNDKLNESIDNCLEGSLISDGIVDKKYFIKFLTDI